MFLLSILSLAKAANQQFVCLCEKSCIQKECSNNIYAYTNNNFQGALSAVASKQLPLYVENMVTIPMEIVGMNPLVVVGTSPMLSRPIFIFKDLSLNYNLTILNVKPVFEVEATQPTKSVAPLPTNNPTLSPATIKSEEKSATEDISITATVEINAQTPEITKQKESTIDEEILEHSSEHNDETIEQKESTKENEVIIEHSSEAKEVIEPKESIEQSKDVFEHSSETNEAIESKESIKHVEETIEYSSEHNEEKIESIELTKQSEENDVNSSEGNEVAPEENGGSSLADEQGKDEKLSSFENGKISGDPNTLDIDPSIHSEKKALLLETTVYNFAQIVLVNSPVAAVDGTISVAVAKADVTSISSIQSIYVSQAISLDASLLKSITIGDQSTTLIAGNDKVQINGPGMEIITPTDTSNINLAVTPNAKPSSTLLLNLTSGSPLTVTFDDSWAGVEKPETIEIQVGNVDSVTFQGSDKIASPPVVIKDKDNKDITNQVTVNTIIVPTTKKSGVSKGVIAGICVACACVVIAFISILVISLKRRPKLSSSSE